MERRDKRIEKKLQELSKHYPDNIYEVKEVTVSNRNKEHKLIQIKRFGRRPHKISKKNLISQTTI